MNQFLQEDTEALHALLCNDVLSENNAPSVRIIIEWGLIRIYLGNKAEVRDKIWEVFDQVS